MNFMGSKQETCGCNQVPTMAPTYQQYNQVVQTCNVEEIPHMVDYHTHVVNNLVKRHINVPTYSQSYENVVINEYAQNPVMMMGGCQYGQQQYYAPMYNQMPQYQGNVGTNPYPTNMANPYQMPQNQNINIPNGM